VTGLTPSPTSYGVVGLLATRTTTAGNLTASATSWTSRQAASAWSIGEMAELDRLSGYSGGNVTFALTGSVNPVAGILVDLL
jgi:hypothetical protein